MKVNNFGTTVHNLKVESQKAELKHTDPAAKTPFGQDVAAAAKAKNAERTATDVAAAGALETEVPADVQRNKDIIEATLDGVDIQAGSRPQLVTLKVVIEEINLSLEPELGPKAIETAYDTGLDISPEATADRILSLSTRMFSAFSEANPELEGDALVDRFIEVIGSGIERGFSEARTILDQMGVLQGEISDNIDATYDLVRQGLESFREANLSTMTAESEDQSSTDPTDNTPTESQG